MSNGYDSNRVDVDDELESHQPTNESGRHASLNEEIQMSSENREYTSEIYNRKNGGRLKPLSLDCSDQRIETMPITSPARHENLVPLNDHKHTARCDSNDTLNSEMSQETILVKPQKSQIVDEEDVLDGSRCSEIANLLLSPQTEHGNTPTAENRSHFSSSPVHFSKNKAHEELRKKLEPKNNHQYAQERQYRVVLAGDAAVGKSSFILQLCTGYFHNRITSTLGVDFHTKAFDIDGKLTNLQLWDTAGQERFRAMAKSYFRRADGAILLYDVTFEQSFLHVRDWVETIESGANRKIPIIICANKSDSIPECIEKGIPYVPKEDGETLARTYDATFIQVYIFIKVNERLFFNKF